MRASDRERDATISILRAGCVAGQLSPATLELRVGQALAARSVEDLRQLTADVQRIPRLRRWLRRLRPDQKPRAGTCSLALDSINEGVFVVGRDQGADLIIGDEAVSRRHAQIVRDDESYLLTDLGSTNGTWLCGRRVGQIEVGRGDVIEVGNVAIRLV